MNVIMRLEFELAYIDISDIQDVHQYTKETSPVLALLGTFLDQSFGKFKPEKQGKPL